MHYIYGIILILIGIMIIKYGDKGLNIEGGTITKLFTLPPIHAKFVKWAAGLVSLYFGLGFILKWWSK